MADGEGCVCGACCESQCACDVDWSSKEMQILITENAQLKKNLAEAQREVCAYEAKEKQAVYDEFVGRYLSNTPQRVAYRRGWNCFEKEGR